MAKQNEPFNIFYGLLVFVGIAFGVTAFAYFVMAIRARSTMIAEAPGLMTLLDRHGAALLGIELALLALCTVGAIGWDHFWSHRERPKQAVSPDGEITLNHTKSES